MFTRERERESERERERERERCGGGGGQTIAPLRFKAGSVQVCHISAHDQNEGKRRGWDGLCVCVYVTHLSL